MDFDAMGFNAKSHFFILFRTLVICQNRKRPGFYTVTETRFINNSRSKRN